MSLGEEMTVFDIKYKEAMERLDSLYSTEEDNNFNSIKNYIERFKLDRSIENRNNQKKENSKGKSDEKRKQIVDLYEIKIHEKKAQHYYNKNYLKNEIEWYKIKQREDELDSYLIDDYYDKNNQVNTNNTNLTLDSYINRNETFEEKLRKKNQKLSNINSKIDTENNLLESEILVYRGKANRKEINSMEQQNNNISTANLKLNLLNL